MSVDSLAGTGGVGWVEGCTSALGKQMQLAGNAQDPRPYPRGPYRSWLLLAAHSCALVLFLKQIQRFSLKICKQEVLNPTRVYLLISGPSPLSLSGSVIKKLLAQLIFAK